jgi:hypothetical protein
MYYALTLNAQGTNAPAFYSLTPTSDLTISQGGATLAPSSPSQSGIIVNIYPQTMQVSAPAGLVSAGVTIITKEPRISGRVMVSPAITVATVVTLYGNGGQQLGQTIIDPGVSSGTFDFPIPPGSGLADAAEAQQFLTQKLGGQAPQGEY